MNLDVSTDLGMTYVYDKINEKLEETGSNPLVLAILVSIVLIYVLLFKILGKGQQITPQANNTTRFVELFAWAIFCEISLIRFSTNFASSRSNVLTVPTISTVSGIIFDAVPALIWVTDITTFL